MEWTLGKRRVHITVKVGLGVEEESPRGEPELRLQSVRVLC